MVRSHIVRNTGRCLCRRCRYVKGGGRSPFACIGLGNARDMPQFCRARQLTRREMQEDLGMHRLTKPGYRFLAELIIFPSAIGMVALILSVLVD